MALASRRERIKPLVPAGMRHPCPDRTCRGSVILTKRSAGLLMGNCEICGRTGAKLR